MKASDLDWDYLRQGMVLPLAFAVAGLVAFGASYGYGASGLRALAEREQRLAELDAARLELASRVQARERFSRRFEALAAAGVTGAEQRLAWAQAFSDVAARLGLPYLRYTALPREQGAAQLPTGETVAVGVSTVEVQAGVVHELDLLALFDALRAAPGLLQVAGCSIERADGAAGADAPLAPRANLAANCQLRWVTIPAEPGVLMAEAGS
jgi:hypothetical protein